MHLTVEQADVGIRSSGIGVVIQIQTLGFVGQITRIDVPVQRRRQRCAVNDRLELTRFALLGRVDDVRTLPDNNQIAVFVAAKVVVNRQVVVAQILNLLDNV